MIIILHLTPAEKETLLELLASARDQGPEFPSGESARHQDFRWQSRHLSTLRHKVDVQIREQENDRGPENY